MSRKNMKKAFAKSFQGGFGQQQAEGGDDIPYAMLKAARHSGQLNISNRSLKTVPEKVWKVNIDVPEEAQKVSLADTDERWWDQVDLKKLILASNQITEISSDIQHVPLLTVLDAHDNCIDSLAEEIGELKEIVKLHLSHNKLSKFPLSFCNLATLNTLLLTSNEISQLPEDFGYLCNLEELELGSNKLTTLPESFGNLHKIRKLNLSKNQITDLPIGFSCLTSLRDLDLSSNKLTTLPSGFGKLTSLEILECRYNLITSITKFTDKANIKQLFLGYNRIRELPDDTFEEFPYLVSLDLRDNSISTLPQSLLCLKLLDRLDLTNNNISGLPHALGTMNLKSLSLEGNPMRGIRRDIMARGTQAILDYLKSRMPVASEPLPVAEVKSSSLNVAQSSDSNVVTQELHNLDIKSEKATVHEPSKAVVEKYLIATTKVLTHHSGAANIPDEVWLEGAKINNIDFSKNMLKEFPEKIVNYAETLSELNISTNKITVLPPAIGSLSKLTFLDVSSNQIQSLPEEICKLPHLLQIVLSFNRFASIPKSLFKMAKLQTLLIANNQISDIDVEGLLELKSLLTLDLSNNSIARIPPQLGNVQWLKSLTLDGNAFRAPRPQIINKGTQFLLEYLRDRIPN